MLWNLNRLRILVEVYFDLHSPLLDLESCTVIVVVAAAAAFPLSPPYTVGVCLVRPACLEYLQLYVKL